MRWGEGLESGGEALKWLRVSLLAAVATILAVRFPADLAAKGLSPLWLFLPALEFGLVARPRAAAMAGWCFGLLADLLSLEPLGLHAFLFGGAALLLARFRGLFFSDHPLTQAVTGLALALLVNLVLLVRLEVVAPGLRFFETVPAAILAAVLTGLSLPVLAVVDDRIGISRGFRAGERRVRA